VAQELVPIESKQPVALHTVDEIGRMAKAITASGLFGIKTVEQAAALMLIAQAEGLHPATAARDYHIIQGRPTLKADAMLARFQTFGGRVEWHELTDYKAEATFIHAQGGSVKLSWDTARAKQAGLSVGKDNWQKYPRAMLRARLISEGVRTVYPGCVVGTYTPEEVEELDQPKRKKAPVDVTKIAEVTTSTDDLKNDEFVKQLDAAEAASKTK
jgi:hypothetical protein